MKGKSNLGENKKPKDKNEFRRETSFFFIFLILITIDLLVWFILYEEFSCFKVYYALYYSASLSVQML